MYPACNHRFPGALAPSEKTGRETLRLYDFVVVASQLLRRGATFGALRAFQPYAYGREDQKAQPSDDHVQLKLPGLTAMGLLPEEDAAIKRQVNRLHKSRPSDLSYMERWHHLEWHRLRKNGGLDWRRRRNCLHGLEVIIRVDLTSTALIDFLDGCLMGDPPFVELATPSRAPTEVVIELLTRARHHVLEAGQFVLQVLHCILKDIQLGRLLPNHLPEVKGLDNGVLLNITNRYTTKTTYLGLLLPQHPPEMVNHVQI